MTTEEIYRLLKTETYNDHTKFGGLVYERDFYTDYNVNKKIADRITRDRRFDEKCRKNIENRDKYKNCKKGTKTWTN